MQFNFMYHPDIQKVEVMNLESMEYLLVPVDSIGDLIDTLTEIKEKINSADVIGQSRIETFRKLHESFPTNVWVKHEGEI